jgi:hypothetical protein
MALDASNSGIFREMPISLPFTSFSLELEGEVATGWPD